MTLSKLLIQNKFKSALLNKLQKKFEDSLEAKNENEAIEHCLSIAQQLHSKNDYTVLRHYIEFLELKENVFVDEILRDNYYNLLANYFIYIRSNKKALKYLSKLVKIYSEKKENLKLSETYNSIGIVKDYLLDYQNALEFFENAFNIAVSSNSMKYKATLLRNQALMHLKLKRADKAYEIYMEALNFIKLEKDTEHFKAILNGNIAEVFLVKEDVKKALTYYEKSKLLFEKNNKTDSKFYSQLLLELGEAYSKNGDKEKELACYLTAKEHFEKLDFPQLSKDVYFKLYEYYEREGEFALALNNYKLFHDLELQKVKDDFHQESEASRYEIELKQKSNFIDFQRELIDVKNKANDLLNKSNKKLSDEIALRKEKEKELKELNEGLDRFISVASHDLKEPLRTISGYSSLLKRRIESENEKELIGFINDGAKRMLNLLNDLLQYSRATHKTMEQEAIDLNVLFGVVKTNLEAQIKASNAIIECDKLPSLVGQQFLYLQIIQNLITNAIKYQPKGQQPHLIIKAQVIDNKHVISFTDNGIGIDEKNLKAIFEPFRRLQSRSEYEGSGIGLATVKRLVERLNGEILVTSELGKGSTFTLSFNVQG